MRFNNSRPNRYLDPALDGAAGGAAPAGSPAGDAAPAFDPDAYKAEFETRLTSEVQRVNGEWQGRFQELEGRLPKPAPQEPKADKEPDAESGDYDFSKPGEFQRFQRELTQYHLRQQFTEREAQWSEQQKSEEREKNESEIISSATQRDKAYGESNPEYIKLLQGASINVQRQVGLAIMDSEFSPQIKEYLAKNPQKTQEIRETASKGFLGMEKALRMVGRIEAQFEAKTVPTAPSFPAPKPTRAAFGGGAAKPTQRDPMEIAKEWRN